jgi:hypothetical protein
MNSDFNRNIKRSFFLFIISLVLSLCGPIQASVTEDAKIISHDGMPGDLFGLSISVSGNLAIAGSFYSDDIQTDSGSAYIYAKTSGNTWVQQTEIKPSDPQASMGFGFSVSMSGNTALVGSAFSDGSAGAAYVYANTTGNTWVEQVKIKSLDAKANDYFGSSVVLSGNLAFIGSAGSQGAVYVFSNTTGNTWAQQTKITASDGADGDSFGVSLGVSGNLLVVGSESDDDAGLSSGSAYVFANTTGNTWVQQTKLTASDGAKDDYFGGSVAVSGNVVIVGSRQDDADSDNRNEGSAYIYANTTGNTWVQQLKLVATDRAQNANFGRSVTLSGNVAVVGSPQDDDGGDSSGSAYIFIHTGGNTWFPYDKLVASDSSASDQFGYAVSLSGNTVAIGAPYKNTFAGSAYIKDNNYSSFLSRPSVTLSVNTQELTRVPRTTAKLTLALSWTSTSSVSANILLTGSASAVSGQAYTFSSTNTSWSANILTVTFSPGTQSQTIDMTPAYSGNFIGTKSVTMSMAAGTGYTFQPVSRSLIIQDELPQSLSALDKANGDFFGYSVSISDNLAIVGSYKDDDSGESSGSAYIYANTSGNTWTQQTKLVASDAEADDRFGYSVAISGNLAIVGSRLDDAGGSNSGSAYIYANTSGNTWVQQMRITASDAESDDYFGTAVAISGNQVVVGSYGDDNVGSSSGSAYVYANTSGNTWTQQRKITASDAASGDDFGSSVAISGNLIVIGAYDDDSTAGAAYIYANTGGNTWVEQSKIVASDRGNGDRFGYSISISGNLIIVGAYANDDASFSSGSAYIFANTSGNTWSEQVKLTASDADGGDYFGYSVSISDNLVIIGSYNDDDRGGNSGSAYIFANTSGNTWVEQNKITRSTATGSDYFGHSVSLSGKKAIIGSHQYDNPDSNTGLATVFSIAPLNLPSLSLSSNVLEISRNLTQKATVTLALSKALKTDLETKILLSGTASTNQGEDYTLSGNHASLSGNVLTVTFPTGTVSQAVTLSSVSNGIFRGTKTVKMDILSSSDYTLQSSSNTLSIQDEPPQRITAFDAATSDFFGWSVSMSGNIAIVGSPFENHAGASSGAAYIYANASGNHWALQRKIVASDAALADNFGLSVAISGNLAIVGSPNDDDGGNGSGSAYIYANTTGNTWVQQRKITASDAAGSDFFGVSVSISGNMVIVGSWQDDDHGINSGSAYIYANTTGNTWVEQTKITASNAAFVDNFGGSVFISSNVAIVGSVQGDGEVADSGAAYVFTNTSGNTWIEQTKIMASDGASGDQFGISVSLSGNLAVVGSYLDDDGGSSSGSAYVFANTSGNTWVQQTKITASDAAVNDYFGISVSASGNKIVVGSYLDDDAGSGSGSAYVFANTSGNIWLEQGKLTPSDSSKFENFGYSVSLSGRSAIIGSTGYGGGGGEDAFGSATVFNIASFPSVGVVTTDAIATESGSNTGTLGIYLPSPATTEITVNLTLGGNVSLVTGQDVVISGANVTWTGGSDVRVTIKAGSNLSTVIVDPVDDDLVEGTEVLQLTLVNGSGYLHNNESTTITLTDDDKPSLSIISSDTSATEAGTTTGNVVFIMAQNPVVTTQVNLILGGTASTTLSEDYALGGSGVSWTGGTSANVTFQAGSNTVVLTLTPVDDVISENEETISITLSDGSGYTHSSDSRTISLADNDNTAPVITEGSVQAMTISEDSSPTAFNLELNATDKESDTLTWSISSAASNGTATASGTGTKKSIQYTPSLNYNGNDSFTVQVSDGAVMDTITVNVTIEAVNDAPIVTAPAAQNLSPGETFSLVISASDIDGDILTLRFLDAARSWVNILGTTLSGTVPDFEADQNLGFRMGVSDGTATSEVFVNFSIAPLTEGGNSVTKSFATAVTITSSDNLPIQEAKIQIFGQQLYYTDSTGKVNLSLSTEISSVIEVSAEGYLPRTLTLPVETNEISLSLEKASLMLSGVVNLSDVANPLGAVVAATSNLGTLETEVDGNGTYLLSLPQGKTTWTFGAGFDGYASQTRTASTTSSNSSLLQNFTLTKETQFSWKSHQSGPGDLITVWVTSNPAFSSGDEGTAQVSVSAGSFSAVTYESSRTALTFTITPPAESGNIQLDFSAVPTLASLQRLKLSVALAQTGDEKQNLHFFQQLSHVSGTQGQVSLTGLDEVEEDLSGLEVPAFGVSSNVEAIRMERVLEEVAQSPTENPIYSIDAFLIDDATGDLTKLGNENITEIYLTFSYNPDRWSPVRDQITYSEDNGVTWQSVPQSDIVSVDPSRKTVTIRSDHLSLWTLNELEGLIGISGGSSGGGGCLLKSGVQQ